jgi:hypothetical protein
VAMDDSTVASSVVSRTLWGREISHRVMVMILSIIPVVVSLCR